MLQTALYSPATAIPLLVVPILLAFRPVLDSDWAWLWDDHENFVDNARVHRMDLAWALSDGVILDVYEPVSLLFKMLLHPLLGLDPSGCIASTRWALRGYPACC